MPLGSDAMSYGYFDDTHREYVITAPQTPSPWINYFGCEQFFSLFSQTGGGYCFFRDPRLRRITRYRYNNTPIDSNGRYFYIRDEADGDYWSSDHVRAVWLSQTKTLGNYRSASVPVNHTVGLFRR